MKVAMFVRDEKMRALNTEAMQAIIFHIDNDLITGVEHEHLFCRNLNYISLWLINKQINEIYIREADDKIRDYFKKMDIIVKTHEDISDNPLFKAFLL